METDYWDAVRNVRSGHAARRSAWDMRLTIVGGKDAFALRKTLEPIATYTPSHADMFAKDWFHHIDPTTQDAQTSEIKMGTLEWAFRDAVQASAENIVLKFRRKAWRKGANVHVWHVGELDWPCLVFTDDKGMKSAWNITADDSIENDYEVEQEEGEWD